MVPMFAMAHEIDDDEWHKFGATIFIVTTGGVIWIVKAFVSHYLGLQGSQRAEKLSEERPTKKLLGVGIVDDLVK
jgi:hypothetical protein